MFAAAFGALVLLAGLALVLAVPVVSLVRATRAAREVAHLRAAVDDLRRQIASLDATAAPSRRVPAEAQREIGPSRLEVGPAPPPGGADGAAPSSNGSGEVRVGTGGAASSRDMGVGVPPPAAVPDAAAAGPPPARPSSSPPGPSPLRPLPPSALETRIGARWLLYAALGSLLLGATFFVKYAFDNAWVTPLARVLIGAAGGAALIGLGRQVGRRGLAFFGDMLTAGGLAILYVAVYAAFHFYELVGPTLAFALMAAVTGLAAGLADAHRSQGLALVALAGGFATPFLLSTGRDDHVQLFTYDAVLVAGTLWLARRRQWPALHVVSFTLTWLSVLAWLVTSYRPSHWASTFAFLTLFCGLFLAILASSRRPPRRVAARAAVAVLSFGPVLYHFAALAVLWPHATWTAAYLIAFSAAGIAIAAPLGAGWLRLLVLGLAAVPMAGWIAAHGGASWLVAGTTVVVAIYGLHLLATLRTAAAAGARPAAADVALVHAEGAWLFGGLYSLHTDHAAAWMGTLAAALAVWNALLAAAIARPPRDAAASGDHEAGAGTHTEPAGTRLDPAAAGGGAPPEVWLHFAALAFAFAATALWLELDPRVVTAGWAAEGAALAWLGHAARRDWLRLGGAMVLLVAYVRVAESLLGPGAAPAWPVANVRTGVALFMVALLVWLARQAERRAPGEPGAGAERDLLAVGAALLGLLVMTAEITAVFDRQAWVRAPAGQAGPVTAADLARAVSLSLGWAAYALLALLVGLRRRRAALRYFAIAVFGFTLAKLVFVDLTRLDRGWRIVSFLGLGALLLGASSLYQRLAQREERVPSAPPGGHP